MNHRTTRLLAKSACNASHGLNGDEVFRDGSPVVARGNDGSGSGLIGNDGLAHQEVNRDGDDTLNDDLDTSTDANHPDRSGTARSDGGH